MVTNGKALSYFNRKHHLAILRQIGNGFITWEKLKDFVEKRLK
jgi:hypothetical protein